VNGVQATNNGDGTWSVNNIAETPGGTAQFYISAYPVSDVLSPNTINPLLNPLETDSVNIFQEIDKPSRLYVDTFNESYYDNQQINETSLDPPGTTAEQQSAMVQTMQWADGAGGSYTAKVTVTDNESPIPYPLPPGFFPNTSFNNEVDNLPASSWPDLVGGALIQTESDAQGDSSTTTNDDVIPHPVTQESYASASDTQYIADASVPGLAWVDYGLCTLNANDLQSGSAQATMKLFTGGKGVMQQNLWNLSASAAKLYPAVAIPPPFSIGSAGETDPTGNAWAVFAAGITVDTTVKANSPGYTFGDGAVEYTFTHVTIVPALTDTNLARLNLGVGEQVILGGMPGSTIWSTSAGRLSATTGSTINFFAPSNAASVTVTASVNGQQIATTFKVFEPSGLARVKTVGTNHYALGKR
jgi:hypothetical protein